MMTLIPVGKYKLRLSLFQHYVQEDGVIEECNHDYWYLLDVTWFYPVPKTSEGSLGFQRHNIFKVEFDKVRGFYVRLFHRTVKAYSQPRRAAVA